MENQTPETQEQQASPELTISDLQNIRSIIEVSARRGAFGAAEMEAVGATFNKLAKFLEAVAPQQPAEEQSADQTPAA
jgi:hypothetical protein